MIGYEIELVGFDEQIERLGRYDQIAEQHTRRAMLQSVTLVEAGTRAVWPVGVSGRSRNSIASRVYSEPGSLVVGRVGSTLKEVYPAVIEFGRRAGAPQPPSGPGSPLARWVHIVLGGGVSPFVIARSIARKGIKAKRPLRKTFERSKARILDFFDRALERIAEDLAGKGE